MQFVFYPGPWKSNRVLLIMWRCFCLRKSGVFEHIKTPQSRKVPGRKSRVSRKANRKPFLGFSVSFVELDLTRDSSQSKPERPQSWYQRMTKWGTFPPEASRKGFRKQNCKKVIIWAGVHVSRLRPANLPFPFLAFVNQKSVWANEGSKNPQSRKVPGRKRGVSRKANRKGNYEKDTSTE